MIRLVLWGWLLASGGFLLGWICRGLTNDTQRHFSIRTQGERGTGGAKTMKAMRAGCSRVCSWRKSPLTGECDMAWKKEKRSDVSDRLPQAVLNALHGFMVATAPPGWRWDAAMTEWEYNTFLTLVDRLNKWVVPCVDGETPVRREWKWADENG